MSIGTIDGMGWVTLLDGGEAQCSLNGEVIEGEVYFIVENDGQCEHFTSYEEALKAYIEIISVKKPSVISHASK